MPVLLSENSRVTEIGPLPENMTLTKIAWFPARKVREMPSGPFRPGDKVPITGIYTALHYQHRMPHEVFAAAGDTFPPCRRCGERANFTLIQAAARIETDQDFCAGTRQRKQKVKTTSPKEN